MKIFGYQYNCRMMINLSYRPISMLYPKRGRISPIPPLYNDSQ